VQSSLILPNCILRRKGNSFSRKSVCWALRKKHNRTRVQKNQTLEQIRERTQILFSSPLWHPVTQSTQPRVQGKSTPTGWTISHWKGRARGQILLPSSPITLKYISFGFADGSVRLNNQSPVDVAYLVWPPIGFPSYPALPPILTSASSIKYQCISLCLFFYFLGTQAKVEARMIRNRRVGWGGVGLGCNMK
jgi:hypothetical protein